MSLRVMVERRLHGVPFLLAVKSPKPVLDLTPKTPLQPFCMVDLQPSKKTLLLRLFNSFFSFPAPSPRPHGKEQRMLRLLHLELHFQGLFSFQHSELVGHFGGTVTLPQRAGDGLAFHLSSNICVEQHSVNLQPHHLKLSKNIIIILKLIRTIK